ncbi:ABC transporter permease [Pseudonocardia eucalypti]|uniref:ABC transporter permease n=1 Tax=Pseudonocardia eucalypti TaxID=648755 RepID=A0ABP9RDW2_9PSEU|nr:ribose transport system permease protein [Pseudonocardia eucalypti]
MTSTAGTITGSATPLAELLRRRGALVVLAVVLAAGGLAFDTFLTTENLGFLSLQAAFPALVALGMTFVIISGGIDLSVGSVFALGGVLAAYASRWGPLPALALPLATGAVIGAVHGLLITRWRLAPFIATLAGLLFARGLLLFLTDEGGRTYLVPPGSVFLWLGQGRLLGIGMPTWIALASFLLGGLVLGRTRFGQRLFAIGGSESAAALMGLPVARTKLAVYTLSGVLAALAGTLAAAQAASGVTIVGVGAELDAIAAVVIGGTLLTGGSGSALGTAAGVALLAALQNLINRIPNLDNSSVQTVVSGAFLIAVIVAQTLLARTAPARGISRVRAGAVSSRGGVSR